MKIQYLTTHFVRKLRLQNPELMIDNVKQLTKEEIQKTDQTLMQYFNHDLILLPFFFDLIDTTDIKLKSLNDNHQHVFQRD